MTDKERHCGNKKEETISGFSPYSSGLLIEPLRNDTSFVMPEIFYQTSMLFLFGTIEVSPPII